MKKLDPIGLGHPRPKLQEGQDENMRDVVKNVKKLGLPQEPIPFSYKGADDGRENPLKNKPKEYEDLEFYALKAGGQAAINNSNIE